MNVFERMPFMAKNAVFRKLAEISDITALSKEEHEKYDESIKILRDNYATFKFAIKEGHDKGRAEGRIEGRAEGQTKEKKQIAQNMLKEGMAVSLICKMTGLDEQEVLKLKDE
jgi:predicted transposase/invertase (TIGR01784 family)